jgi:hypothetical protein
MLFERTIVIYMHYIYLLHATAIHPIYAFERTIVIYMHYLCYMQQRIILIKDTYGTKLI